MYPTDFTPADFTLTNRRQTGEKRPVSLVVIDYGLGNVRSVANALETLGAEVKISRDPSDLHAAEGLILPGVGAFGDGMANLKNFGLIPHLNELALEKRIPFLGICLGMQLLTKSSVEGGHHEGLGWINAEVIKLASDPNHPPLKVPHVGWNDVTIRRTCPILGLPRDVQSYYFVHSYALQCHEPELVAGLCEYSVEFPAVVQKDNILAVQFHPEKSQKHGLNLLANFLNVIRNNSATNYGNQAQSGSATPTSQEATC